MNQTGNDALSRMSIYDVMVLDALGGVAVFGLAILLGFIGPAKGFGGVALCGATAAGLLAYRHLTALTPQEIALQENPDPDPLANDLPTLIAHLEAELASRPGNVVLSGMIIAFKLAYELGGDPPESPGEMLRRLNYGRIIVENGPDICIDADDVENARRYYLAVHWVADV